MDILIKARRHVNYCLVYSYDWTARRYEPSQFVKAWIRSYKWKKGKIWLKDKKLYFDPIPKGR